MDREVLATLKASYDHPVTNICASVSVSAFRMLLDALLSGPAPAQAAGGMAGDDRVEAVAIALWQTAFPPRPMTTGTHWWKADKADAGSNAWRRLARDILAVADFAQTGALAAPASPAAVTEAMLGRAKTAASTEGYALYPIYLVGKEPDDGGFDDAWCAALTAALSAKEG